MTILHAIKLFFRSNKKYDRYLEERRELLRKVFTIWTEHEERGWFAPEELRCVHELQRRVHALSSAYPTRNTMKELCAIQADYEKVRLLVSAREQRERHSATNNAVSAQPLTAQEQRCVDDYCHCFCDCDH